MAKVSGKPFTKKQTTKPEEVKMPVEEVIQNKKESKTPTQKITAVIKDCSKLRLRVGPSTVAEVDTVLTKDDSIVIKSYDPKAEWTKVLQVNDKVLDGNRYVMTKFIEVK